MTDTAPSLLPCPFCGSHAISVLPPTCTPNSLYNPADRAFPIVRCRLCLAEAHGDNWDTGASAVAAWNRRAAPAAQPADDDVAKLVERLQSAALNYGDRLYREAADTIERLTKERDEARRLVGLARRLAGAVQRFRNLPGLERSKLRETPEYHDLCERWRAFQDADGRAALKEGGADAG
ncbi:MAG TPA: Lar family restriction alleviation protein [Calditerricola sp.]